VLVVLAIEPVAFVQLSVDRRDSQVQCGVECSLMNVVDVANQDAVVDAMDQQSVTSL